MTKPIINIDDLEFTSFGKGDKFHAERGPVSPHIGSSRLGYAVIKLQPGKRAWPYHSHYNIEEMFYVISGSGTLRHAGEEYVRLPDVRNVSEDAFRPASDVTTGATGSRGGKDDQVRPIHAVPASRQGCLSARCVRARRGRVRRG